MDLKNIYALKLIQTQIILFIFCSLLKIKQLEYLNDHNI